MRRVSFLLLVRFPLVFFRGGDYIVIILRAFEQFQLKIKRKSKKEKLKYKTKGNERKNKTPRFTAKSTCLVNIHTIWMLNVEKYCLFSAFCFPLIYTLNNFFGSKLTNPNKNIKKKNCNNNKKLLAWEQKERCGWKCVGPSSTYFINERKNKKKKCCFKQNTNTATDTEHTKFAKCGNFLEYFGLFSGFCTIIE